MSDRIRQLSRKLVRVVFVTPGGAALITVICGGLMVTFVSSLLNDRLKERELLLLDAQEYSRERIAAAREIYALTGSAIAISRELLSIAGEEFEPHQSRSAAEELEVGKHRARVIRDYNSFIREWHKGREGVGLILMYYYPCSEDVIGRWSEVEAVANDYLQCSATARERQDVEQCIVRYQELTHRLEDLTFALVDEWKRAQARTDRWRHDC